MQAVLEQIVNTGAAPAASGETVQVHSHISPAEVAFLTRLAEETDISVSLEIGLAFGVSALAICEGLANKPGVRHIVIDPFANDPRYWRGVGLNNLERAGFRKMVEFHEAPSSTVLPHLEAEGEQIDFAFIDGEHTFDYVLVDFFYIDKLLRVGGIVVFDDADWRSVRKALRFVLTNRNYEVYRTLPRADYHPTLRWKLYKAALAIPSLAVRALRALPGMERIADLIFGSDLLGVDERFNLFGGCIALRKLGDDKRGVHSYSSF